MRAKPYDAVNIIRHANGYSLEAVPANLGAAGTLNRPAPLEDVQVFNSIDALFTHLRRGFQESEPENTCSVSRSDTAANLQGQINRLNLVLADVANATSEKAQQVDVRLGRLEAFESERQKRSEASNRKRHLAAKKRAPAKRKR